jgi:DnaJ-class molecular chaperone
MIKEKKVEKKEVKCPVCNGTGMKDVDYKCEACSGTGVKGK